PILWMAMIAVLSSDIGSAAHSASLLVPLLRALFPWVHPDYIALAHGLVRKLGHVVEYAILAALWYRALRRERGLRPWASVWTALAVSVVWAGLDGLHQSTVPSRTASAPHVLRD